MEPARKRIFSPVWQHFELISDTKVKCLLCSKELGYNNNTSMLRHYRALHENKEAAQPSSDLVPLSSENYIIMAECIKVLAPFYEATLELSEEKRVSGSKLIPILTMLHHALEEGDLGILETQESRGLTESLRRQIQDKLYVYQSKSITSLATILDPRFKKLGFLSPKKAEEAEKRLIAECAAVLRNTSSSFSSTASSSETSLPGTQVFRRKWYNERREGPFEVVRSTGTAVQVKGSPTCHLSHCVKVPREEGPLSLSKEQDENVDTHAAGQEMHENLQHQGSKEEIVPVVDNDDFVDFSDDARNNDADNGQERRFRDRDFQQVPETIEHTSEGFKTRQL
ncbi:hypothetical protein PAMP_012587 [Pampus punctatissimus]